MAATQDNRRSRVSIYLEPALRREVESAASHSGVSVEEYVACVLRDAVSAQPPGNARSDPAYRPETGSRQGSDAQREDQDSSVTAALEALRRKRRLTLEDVVGVLPPLGVPVEEMIRLAKEERAVRAGQPGSDDRCRR